MEQQIVTCLREKGARVDQRCVFELSLVAFGESIGLE